MNAGFWGYLIGQMEDPAAVWNFTVFSVKSYTPFLKDTCAFVIPFWSSVRLTGLEFKEKCTCNQLANSCVQMGVFLLLYVKH